MKTRHETHTPRYAFLLLLVLIVLLVSSPGQAQIYGPSPVPLRAIQTPASLSYFKPLNSQSQFFVKVSGNIDRDDPLSDFHSYINDPLNWDPTTPIDHQYVYQGNFGYLQTGRMWDIPGTASLGIRTRVDQAFVDYRPPFPVEEYSNPIPLSLLDGLFAPYVTLQAQPFSWFRVLGDARLNIVSFDLQRVCNLTCSKEPTGVGNEVIPSLKGRFILGPWVGTELFLNLGRVEHWP